MQKDDASDLTRLIVPGWRGGIHRLIAPGAEKWGEHREGGVSQAKYQPDQAVKRQVNINLFFAVTLEKNKKKRDRRITGHRRE